MKDFEERDELTRELRARSEDVGGHPIGMNAVRRTARRIVWRRRLVTGAVAAVVLAVAVPAGMAATGGVDHGSGPIGRPSPTVTHAGPTPSPTPPPTPTPTEPSPTGTPLPAAAIPLTMAGVSQGAPPKIIYLQGDTLHNGDVTEQLPGSYTDITAYHGGWIALSPTNGGGYSLVQLDATNHVIGTPQPSAAGIAVDNGGGRTTWFVAAASGQPGQLVSGIATGMGEGQTSVPVPPGVTAHPVGYVRTGLVYDTDGAHPQVLVTDFTPGTAPQVIPGAINAGGASPAADAITVQTKSTDFGSCWRVVDPAGQARWHTCDYSLGQFSPDGKYIAAGPPYADGLGPASVTILDARTGKPVADFQRPTDSDLYVAGVAWEDETHLLAIVHENGSWQIVRMDTSGHLEAATPAVAGSDENRPFFFSARP